MVRIQTYQWTRADKYTNRIAEMPEEIPADTES